MRVRFKEGGGSGLLSVDAVAPIFVAFRQTTASSEGTVGNLGNLVRSQFDLDHLPTPEWGQHRPAGMLRFALARAGTVQSIEGGRVRLSNYRSSRDLPNQFPRCPRGRSNRGADHDAAEGSPTLPFSRTGARHLLSGSTTGPARFGRKDSSFANRSWDRSQLLFLRAAGCRISPVLSELHRAE
jgi:hypothetical protein